MNLCAGQEWRRSTENGLLDTVGAGVGRRGWDKWTQRARKHIHQHLQDRAPVAIWCMTQGAQTGALGQPRGAGWGGRWEVGGRLNREGAYVHLRLSHADVWQKPAQYHNYPSLKNERKNPLRNAGDMGSIAGPGIKIPHAVGQLRLCTREETSTRHNQRKVHTQQRWHRAVKNTVTKTSFVQKNNLEGI